MKKLSAFSLVFVLFLINWSPAGPGYEIGEKVSDFKLKNIDGSFVSLSDNPSHKGYILVFTCNTCPWARGYEQRIIDLHMKYAGKGYPVIAIQPNDPSISKGDSFDEMIKRAKDKKYPYPYLIDETQEITMAYGATKTPDVFIVEKKSKDYFLRYKGTIDDSPRNGSQAKEKYVEQAVDELLSGKDVGTKSTKGIGCSIKWSSASKEKMGKS